MTESIGIELQLAAVALAEELSYARAAQRLQITQSALRAKIAGLEKQLEFYVFRPKQRRVEVSEEGRIFVNACRTFLIQAGRLQKQMNSCGRIKRAELKDDALTQWATGRKGR